MRQGSATTTSTYTYEGLTLLSLDATSEEGTAAASWRIDYLADSTGRPYGGIYTSRETSAVAFGIVTTDRGDVRELTDGAGAPFARYDHDAYGNPTRTLTAATPELDAATPGLDAATAEAIAGRNILRYAGYAFDEHSGLYYLSQRYYDPATCQFITKDPAKADGEESAYQYCGGDPVGKVDPSGEWAQVIWMTRVPTYKLSSWAKLQALNVLTSAAIAKAVGRSIWRYAATRLQANLLSKSATYITKRMHWLAKTLLARPLTRIMNFSERYSTAWDINRPEIMLMIFRETTKRAVFVKASYRTLRVPMRPSSGYAERLRIDPIRLATDGQITEWAKTAAYCMAAR